MERMMAVHQAAQAPRLMDLAERLAQRVACQLVSGTYRSKMDHWLVEEAKDVLADARAVWVQVPALALRGQREFHLETEVAGRTVAASSATVA